MPLFFMQKTTLNSKRKSSFALPKKDLLPKPKKPSQSSVLENKFRLLWSTISKTELVEEHRFHDTRKWRLDFAHIEAKVGIEIQGGIWNGGRHGRGYGIAQDNEKSNEAIFCGWVIIKLAGNQITTETLEKIVTLIKTRSIF
jgi:very-short-patch-repair endonuclease